MITPSLQFIPQMITLLYLLKYLLTSQIRVNRVEQLIRTDKISNKLYQIGIPHSLYRLKTIFVTNL